MDLNSTVPVFPMKEFVFPPPPLEFFGLFVIFALTFLASAGGLGGGGITIPFMMIFFDLSLFECVPLANVFGMASSVIRFAINFKQLHPNPANAKNKRLSIDYELVSLVMPMLYLGTLFGVQIGTMLNEATIAVSLFTVLAFTAYATT